MSMRPVYRPGNNFAALPLPVVHLAASQWHRIHLAEHGPVFFSKNGNHRFSPTDGKHQLLYAAQDFETAWMEVFGDQIFGSGSRLSAARWARTSSSIIITPELRLCDLTNSDTRAALQTDLASLLHPDLSIAQAWSSAIMTHPEQVEGILYPSRFTDRTCLALFETEKPLQPQPPVSLSEHDSALTILEKLQIALV